MARPRTNDPAGVSDNPVLVQDPQRTEEITREFGRRLRYIEQSFRTARGTLGDPVSFNRSLERLRKVTVGKSDGPGTRLHPELKLILSFKARQYACERSGDADAKVTSADVARAVEDALTTVKSRRGRPKDAMFKHHVEGLMALVQEVSGRPVRVTRHKDSVYAPQEADRLGGLVIELAQQLAPRAAVHTIINIILAARRTYAGRPMRFRDFFPLYGARIDPDTLLPTGGIGGRLVCCDFASPIYCP